MRRMPTKLRLPALRLEIATHGFCNQIRHGHRGDHKTLGIDGHLQSAREAIDIMLPGLDVSEMEPDRVHLQAYSATDCGHEISQVPSKTLDTHLSQKNRERRAAQLGNRRHGQWLANIRMRRGRVANRARQGGRLVEVIKLHGSVKNFHLCFGTISMFR